MSEVAAPMAQFWRGVRLENLSKRDAEDCLEFLRECPLTYSNWAQAVDACVRRLRIVESRP